MLDPADETDELDALCRELVALARDYVQLGGRFQAVFDRALVFAEIEGLPASRAGDGDSVLKVGQGLRELMLTLRARTAEMKQNQLGVDVV
jgi:hypothetical protein